MNREQLLEECKHLVLHYNLEQDRIMYHMGFITSTYPHFAALVAYIKDKGWTSPFDSTHSIYILFFENEAPSKEFMDLWHDYLEWHGKVTKSAKFGFCPWCGNELKETL